MNAFSDAFQSGLILLREGLEAMLVIAALAAFLHRAGAGDKVKAVYAGAILAYWRASAPPMCSRIFLRPA